MFKEFLLYVTSTADQSVYVLDEMGAHIDTINIDTPIRGIAVDYFTHESTSTNHSFVYSVDSAPKGAWSYVFRKYVGDPPYSGVGDQIFAVIGIKFMKITRGSSFEQTMMGWSPRYYIPSFVKIGTPVPEKKIFEGFYHIWAWRPSWSCDQQHVIRFLFPCTRFRSAK